MPRRRSRLTALVTGAVCVAALVTGLVPSPALAATPPVVTFATVATGLFQPTEVTSTSAVPGHVFVTERTGLVKLVDTTTGVASTYLDLTAVVTSTIGEQGLLGLVFAPDFATSGRLYVTFTDATAALVLRRITVTNPAALTAGAVTSLDLLTVPHPAVGVHNAGGLAFDSAGRLIVSTGDGGPGGAGGVVPDPNFNGRNPNVLLGKILRLDVSAACAPLNYCIPATNPFATTGGRPEIWMTGVRNPWRISTDPATGQVFIADVGQDLWEELNVIPESSTGGDLGWSCMEGLVVFDQARCTSLPAATPAISPVTVMCHAAVAGCAPDDLAGSITGGLVYRGSTYASLLSGAYVFGDFVTGSVWTWAGGVRSRVGNLLNVTSFGSDPAGEIWATTLGGDLVRLQAVPGATPPPVTPPASGGGGGSSSGGSASGGGSGAASTPPATVPVTPIVSPVSVPQPAVVVIARPTRLVGLVVRTHRVSATVRWPLTASATAPVTYQYRYRVSGGTFTPWRSTRQSPLSLKGLRGGTGYVLEMRAVNSSGPGPVARVRFTTMQG